MKIMSLSMGEVMAQHTMVVEFHLSWVRWYRFRLWLGSRILKLGARVIGVGIELNGPREAGYQPIASGTGDPLPPPRNP